MHRQKIHAPGEQQAVSKDNKPNLLEVRQLRRLDFAVDLRERLLAAHRQNRVPKRDEDADESEQAEPTRADCESARRFSAICPIAPSGSCCSSGDRIELGRNFLSVVGNLELSCADPASNSESH